ncbi:MAG: hypothetical protein R2818_11810 [Flavobacteriales bacterium]
MKDLSERIAALREHFERGATRSCCSAESAAGPPCGHQKARRGALTAMHSDIRKPRFEAYAATSGLVYAEIDHALKHMKAWMRSNDRAHHFRCSSRPVKCGQSRSA